MKRILFAIAALIALTSCNLNVDNIIPEYSALEFNSDGGSAEFVLQASGSWTATSNGIDGLVIIPDKGNGSSKVLLIVPANKTDKSRSGGILYVCGKASSTTAVIQSAKEQDKKEEEK